MGVDPSGMGGTPPPNNLVGGTEYIMSPPNNQDFAPPFLKKITMTESSFEKNHDEGEPF